uniref:AAA+ ATPase domain-containing protein n=1 Tax=Chromera velia CCMP2878 TaxID=1169474 RepID=A0A0G4EZA7_9ALVE|eukprot:Cvel_14325.t1-p1 / transcript=Cvel_14325.t1 / gene=Cvel_14325 / organism=Chromera_velia_CCMP2878 / gene_product=Dynein heavy chain 1, axonemal, putative / transcript_product=Dynein heavy chain 1, axonemal, putative / location=Cvel_scaffold1014:5829-17560(-) / protein_length=2132 / sequence_SO=supercontig / SO=protein_coding / is_pseudo=false
MKTQDSLKVTIPGVAEGTASLYDFCYSMEDGGSWSTWNDVGGAYSVPNNATYEGIMVPTQDSIRNSFIFTTLLKNGFHCLMPGPTGTGKTVNVEEWLARGAPDKYQSVNVTFSAQTSENQTQDMLDAKMEKRRKGVFGPPVGKVFVVFVDDLNMPKKEEYGAQPPLELLRQWFDYGGWYDRKELSFREIVDIQMLAAMGPPGGGRTFITNRLVRHYNVLAYCDISDAAIMTIFSTMCNYFFQTFPENVQKLSQALVASTLEVFQTILRELLPTPSKSHYTFNLRDIWKVFQGVCSLKPKSITAPDGVLRGWVHECSRVFGDRLIDDKDRGWLKDLLLEMCKRHFSEAGLIEEAEKKVFIHERLIFGDFLQQGENKLYEEITDMPKMKTTIEEGLEDYNSMSAVQMPLVMFLDACEHVSRICRVLRQPSGNCLLLGVGGSGRQSLSRLASHLMDSAIFQIEVTKSYGPSEWRDDLKSVLLKCGVEDKITSFVFVDTQIVRETMLEDINNILNSGDIPNLYKNEDMDNIITACRPLCVAAGLQPTKTNIFSSYLKRVKSNLHMILAMSPLGEMFRTRLRMFPSLVNCCTIDWFSEWPAEALYSVAKQQLTQGVDLQLPKLEGVLNLFKTIHQTVEHSAVKYKSDQRRYEWAKGARGRHVYVTPTSFLELLSTFRNILSLKRKEISTQQHRFQNGLDKLAAAERDVEAMKIKIQNMQPELEKTQKAVEVQMVQIEKDKADAEVVKGTVAVEESEAATKAEATQAIKDDAQRDLDKALPALDEAVACLKSLKVDHIREVKALGKPPVGVRLTMEAVCIMFQVAPTKKNDPDNPGKKIDDYWESAQAKLLKDPKLLLEKLMGYEKDEIPDSVITKIGPYIDKEDFQPAVIKKASVACEAMCMWVRAMHTYNGVAREVEPKRQALKIAEGELEVTMQKLNAAKAKLQAVVDKLEKLEADYNSSIKKKDDLTKEIEDCQVKLVRAEKLIGGLGGEKTRWTQMVKELGEDMVLIPGNSLVSAGMVAYAGPFIASYRSDMEDSWREELVRLEIPHSEGVTMLKFLGEPVKIRQWNVCGLPSDNLSVENGIVVDKARRWPLMIDPQNQANRYIKELGKKMSPEGIEVIKLSDPGYMKQLELGIQFGRWILLENIGEVLDPSLDPILLQQKIKDGGSWVIRLGDKNISYSDTFRFFMTTTYSNPHYAPEIQVKVTLLNFAITAQGLEDQMLGLVVAKEAPDLEEKKNALVQSNAKMKADLKDLEDTILRLLSQAEGDILEDETLINTLSASKKTSIEINEKVREAEITEKEIDTARESYRPVAFRAAILFFCIIELCNLDPMYQYSLQWYQNLFSMGIDQAAPSAEREERLQNLSDHFTYLLYENVCRSLFEKHKTLFSFALTIRMLMGQNKVDPAEFRFLNTGTVLEPPPDKPNPTEWLTAREWGEMVLLSSLPAFRGLDDYVISHSQDFRRIFDAVEAHKEPFPGEWEGKLKGLQRLCFLRTIRMDRLVEGIIQFVIDTVGERFVDPPSFDLAKSYKDSTNLTPLILILSSGSDPVSDIQAFAEEMNMAKNDKLTSISLGQGQGKKAQRMIEDGCSRGAWVLLQNCHLAASWMTELERIVESLSPEQVHRDFRLWLTSMPAKTFPVAVLQNGVKMTNEPPKGLRANLGRSYEQMNDKQITDCSQPEAYTRLLFGFCFFHAIVQDRRKYGPIGWNIAYEFAKEDLIVSQRQLKLFLDNYDYIPYKVLNYIGAQINYGGRVTDDKDKRLIQYILKTYMNPTLVEQGSGYKFSESGSYFCPEAEDKEGFIEYIKKLPLVPQPEVFGLHENANITFAQNEATFLLDGMLAMGSGGGGSGGKSREDVMSEMADMLEEQTPKLFVLFEIQEKYPTSYEESINTVLVQEVIRYNRLLGEMHSSLKEFKKALKGLVVMSEDLEKMGQSMFDNHVPTNWSKKGFLSLKPLKSWINDLNDRVKFLHKWIEGGTPPAFWMSGLFFPQAFLTGTLQNFARKNKYAVDKLSFDFRFMDTLTVEAIKEKPIDGCYVFGFYIEGARWCEKTHMLGVSMPKVLYEEMPVVWLIPELDRVPPKDKNYNCPLYKVLTRSGTLSTTGHSTNFVMYIDVPSDQVEDVWIKAGVAAFLALKY